MLRDNNQHILIKQEILPKKLRLETPTTPSLLYTLRMITVHSAVAGEVWCSWSQAGIVGLSFPAKNNKYIMDCIVSWTLYRETYRIVTKAYQPIVSKDVQCDNMFS